MAVARKKRNPFYSPYQYHETGSRIPNAQETVPVKGFKVGALKKFKQKGHVTVDVNADWRHK